jgi:hypothetical protein
MKAVEVTRNILEQQRRRPNLTCCIALMQEIGMCLRIPLVHSHTVIPAVRDIGQMGIKRRAKTADEIHCCPV